MILLGRLCRCHYASNPAVSAAVRVACLSAFQASPGPCRPSLGPRLRPPFLLPRAPEFCFPWLPVAFVPQLSFSSMSVHPVCHRVLPSHAHVVIMELPTCLTIPLSPPNHLLAIFFPLVFSFRVSLLLFVLS